MPLRFAASMDPMECNPDGEPIIGESIVLITLFPKSAVEDSMKDPVSPLLC